MQREIEIAVLSDLHLGAFGCQAIQILKYLKRIKAEVIILNGDIIDIWQFDKKNFPKTHLLVLNELLKKAVKGTKVIYLIGNHDDALRRFADYNLGSISLRNQLVLHINGKKHWFFHGDIFDASIMVSPWLAKLGGRGYDFLIRLNHWVNKFKKNTGGNKMSFAHKIKSGVKKAVKYIQDFEGMAIQLAAEKGYDYVVCGHIHQPKIQSVETSHGPITYMNSGDWIEHCTALEYYGDNWQLYNYDEADFEYLNSSQYKFDNELAADELIKKIEPKISQHTIKRLMKETKNHLLL